MPHLAADLSALQGKLVDLLAVMQRHVYHPRFAGCFSIKHVLNPMVPDLTYDDVAIVDGQVASVELARLLFVAHKVRGRDQLRRDLLAYCERDLGDGAIAGPAESSGDVTRGDARRGERPEAACPECAEPRCR
ncbi:MAG: hypothetical protein H0X69_10520 [Gemmatimonadales bacterium]|nr:hypothetical protein [Gemmatimonadales bacterium]